jgi:hypothetical protein
MIAGCILLQKVKLGNILSTEFIVYCLVTYGILWLILKLKVSFLLKCRYVKK